MNLDILNNSMEGFTSIFLYSDNITKEVSNDLDILESKIHIPILRIKLTKGRAEAFKCIYSPTLIIFNKCGIEEMRIFGELKIHSLINEF